MTLIDAYNYMIAELEGSSLLVDLAPAPEQKFEDHCIRVAVEQNVGWYRHLCSIHPGSGSASTAIRKPDVVRLLRNMAEGKSRRSKYKSYLIGVAEGIVKQHTDNEDPF